MKKFLNALLCMAVMAISLQASASPPLPKVSEDGPKAQAIQQVKQRGTGSSSSGMFSTKEQLRKGKALQREAKVAPSATATPKTYSSDVEIPNLFGWVNYSDNFYEFHNDRGVYYLPRNNSESYSLRFKKEDIFANSGVVKDGIYYCSYTLTASYGDYSFTFTYYEGYDLTTADTQNPKRVRYYYSIPSIATAMTLDDSTGTIYGIATDTNSTDQYLATFDFKEAENDFTFTKIGNLPGQWKTIAADRTGQLYGIRYYTTPGSNYDIVTKSELYRIDKNTAEATLIGDTGLKPQFDSDAVIDLNSGRMFWIVCPENENSYIAEVDLTTGQATPLYTLPDDAVIKGLAIDAPPAYDKAPAAVSNAAVNFNGGSLSGTASFTAPTTHFDGSAASGGSLTAKVLANGTPIATKKNITFGQNVTMDITVPQAGLYNFDITVENYDGISPKATVEGVFVGNGTPKAPAPTLTYTGGMMNLSWQAVTESANGGYINPTDVRYTVVRYPGNTEVANNIAGTSFSEQIDEPEEVTNYYYTVTATYAGLSSAAAESNAIMAGSIIPPFLADFNNGLDNFTPINDRDDSFTWSWQESWVSGIDGHGNYMRINTYTTEAPADDWLLSPPLRLEAGKAYKLRFFVVTSTQDDEILEVKMGESRNPADLTTTILEPTTMCYGKGGEIERSIVIDRTGVYTIGFHAISEPGSFYIAIDDVRVSEPYSAEVPQTVSNFKAEAAAMGALSATVSLTSPSLSINGTPLKSLESINVYRGNSSSPIHTFTSPGYNKALSFTDNVDAEGTYEYTAIATNSYGESDAVTTSVFIGTGIPKAPENVRFSRTNTHGEVALTWDAVTENIHNQQINPNDVTYDIYTTDGYHLTELATGLTGTSYTYQAVPEGQQAFMQYVVEPVTAAGNGQSAVSNIDAVGTPYESIHESGQLGYAWYASGAGAMWVRTDSDEVGIAAQDGDDMVYALAGEHIDDAGTLTSGLVSLSAMTKPGITFYTYSMGEEDANTLKVFVTDIATGTRTEVKSIVENELPEYHRWNKIMIPLDAFAGKTISVSFDGRLNSYTLLLIDNISVDNLIDYDLAAEGIRAPSYVSVGTSFNVVATIRNEGMKEATGYKVQLLSGNDVVASCDGNPIPSNTTAEYPFNVNMDIFASEPMEIVATIVYDLDQNPANNTGTPVSVAPTKSHLPAPRGLEASWQNNSAILTWTAPDYQKGVATQFTEDFETAEGWAHEFGDWQFIDVDQSPVGCIMGFTTPGIDYSIDNSSFYVFDTDNEKADESFFTHSGSKMLASLFRWDNKQVDDWAVSPLLDGTAQTIAFYARSYDPDYPETVEVYYTTSDADEFSQDDYTKCATFARLSGEYTELTANLPEGATRFAIRSCATAAYLLLLDDVTFYPDAPRTEVEFLGYDVYRDGRKLNDTPLTEPTFTDSNVASDARYSYFAVALYDKGVSSPSNAASLNDSGIDATAADGITVSAMHHYIVVNGAENRNVAIYSVDGRTIYSAVAPEQLKVAVPDGIYLVKAGNTVAKVVVR